MTWGEIAGRAKRPVLYRGRAAAEQDRHGSNRYLASIRLPCDISRSPAGNPAPVVPSPARSMKTLLVALALALVAHASPACAQTASPAVPPLRGEVLEVLDGGAFTYLRLKTADGETWAAVKRSAVATGARVTLDDPLPMQNFESKALQRKFDVLVFGTLVDVEGGAVSTVPGTPAQRIPDVVTVPRADGPDARTVAEVYAGRLALKDRPVAIRARVAKVTVGVMNRNWIHLQDGSGSAADGSDDLVATSAEEPTVGEVVVARGVVRADVNFGSGYAYRVLVEDATFRK
jgi:hypothetical protein